METPLFNFNTLITVIFPTISFILTVFPIVSLYGFVFTAEGRNDVKHNPLIAIYYIVFFIYFYFYWFDKDAFLAYLKIGLVGMHFAYFLLSAAIILEKKPSM